MLLHAAWPSSVHCFSHAWYVQHPTTYSSEQAAVVASLKTCAVTAMIVLTAIVPQLSGLACC